ncbi:YCF48-related protein [Myxococcota bacterium]|nr:YCF48-related protein [Myxococcota bacterium]
MVHRVLFRSQSWAIAISLVLLMGISTACHVLDLSPRYGPGEIDLFDDLFSVSVPDENHAVAVGYQGSIYYSHDGGETWQKGKSPTEKLLYSISMADKDHGWAVGQLGTILRTNDGGATWVLQPNLKADEKSHLFDVHAIDRDNAWAVGEWGTRIITSDGGETWVDDSLGVDPMHPTFIWLSERDQQRVRRGEKVYEDVGLNNITCLDPPSTHCWMIGEFGYIFWSDDRGATWNRSEIVGDLHMEPMNFGFNDITVGDAYLPQLVAFAEEIADETHVNIKVDTFVNSAEIRELGKTEDPEPLFDLIEARTNEVKSILANAGVGDDRMRMPGKPPWDFEDFLEDDPGFLDRYLEGRLAGQPIVKVSVIQNPYLFTIRFDDENNGLISGLGGVILRTQDGGRTWRYVSTDRKQAIFAVAQGGEQAVAVGEKGLVRVSTDGGASWSREPNEFPRIFTFMRDLDFEADRKVGFIVGQEGMILRTRDGGISWDWVLPPEDRRG